MASPRSDDDNQAIDVTRQSTPSRRRPPPRSSTHGKIRKRSATACDACRSRRTKCDGQKPSCGYCSRHGIECRYIDPPKTQESRIELELAAVKQRLDHLTNLLTNSYHVLPKQDGPTGNEGLSDSDAGQDSPFKFLFTTSIMCALGFDTDFTHNLMRMERSTPLSTLSIGGPRFLLVQHQQAVDALAAFSEKIHIWYPILGSDFTKEYFRIISGPLDLSADSCLALLVTALGCLVQNIESGSSSGEARDTVYFEAALTSLQAVIADYSLISVQCLLFMSIYCCCLLKPYQAHDYIMIASFKVQSLLKVPREHDPVLLDLTNRAYWAVLLLENELNVQLDVVKSDIWSLDEITALPDCRHTWNFAAETVSGLGPSTSPGSVLSVGSTSTDTVQSYFLAEIAMRRMLHRCNTAIRRTVTGEYVYAPGIALELEHQLEEWYHYLPEIIQFEKESHDNNGIGNCILVDFLRVQYYCCKLSIYWPAVYQTIHYRETNSELLAHCQRFFESYIRLTPSIVSTFHHCYVNRWTLFVSIFITSITAIKAVSNPSLSILASAQLYQCFTLTTTVNRDLLGESRSLSTLHHILEQQLAVSAYQST
ncbi:putative C6 transcription factor [Xylogone sp. PMI_703]|nr:putative C6 transcription factor [Xylogone sp. PMI_703]